MRSMVEWARARTGKLGGMAPQSAVSSQTVTGDITAEGCGRRAWMKGQGSLE